MNNDNWPPNNIENQENDFEKIKEEFSEWSKDYLQNLLEDNNKVENGFQYGILEEKIVINLKIEFHSEKYFILMKDFSKIFSNFLSDVDRKIFDSDGGIDKRQRDKFIRKIQTLKQVFVDLNVEEKIDASLDFFNGYLIDILFHDGVYGELGYEFSYSSELFWDSILELLKKKM